MTLTQALDSFAHDALLQSVLVIIAVDLALGVAAAVKTGQFTLARFASFGRDDILGKVVPWFVIYAVAKFAPQVAVLGIDLSAIQKVVYAAVVAALAGSMLSSLKELGINIPVPGALTGGES